MHEGRNRVNLKITFFLLDYVSIHGMLAVISKERDMQKDNGEFGCLSVDEFIRQTQKGNDDLIFCVGETVQVKGGDFRVLSFGKRAMVLEGLPGTRLRR